MNAAELKAKALAVIRETGGIGETKLLEALFPPPPFPADGSEAQINAWREANEHWKDQAYGPRNQNMPWRDTFCGQQCAVIGELEREGLIVSHNNGYAAFSYTPKRHE